METNTWFDTFKGRFASQVPSESTAFSIFGGGWKNDFESKSISEIVKNVESYRIPQLCADVFPHFNEFDVLELGPSEGHHTYELERCGARSVLSIEGNVDSFLKCLVLKNSLNMRSKFLLGDFCKYIQRERLHFDLMFASGVLYHLVDPVGFLIRCGEVSNHIYIWSFYYDKDVVGNNAYELQRFGAEVPSPRVFGGRTFQYYERSYEPVVVGNKKYAGGINPYANWLSRQDLFSAVEVAGFKVVKTFDDSFGGMPAVNILASQS